MVWALAGGRHAANTLAEIAPVILRVVWRHAGHMLAEGRTTAGRWLRSRRPNEGESESRRQRNSQKHRSHRYNSFS